eukprot:398454-Hanusia_phi.AAC.2
MVSNPRMPDVMQGRGDEHGQYVLPRHPLVQVVLDEKAMGCLRGGVNKEGRGREGEAGERDQKKSEST